MELSSLESNPKPENKRTTLIYDGIYMYAVGPRWEENQYHLFSADITSQPVEHYFMIFDKTTS